MAGTTTYQDAIDALAQGRKELEGDMLLPGVIGDCAREMDSWLTKGMAYLMVCRRDAEVLAELDGREG